jgi:hypothetical protein
MLWLHPIHPREDIIGIIPLQTAGDNGKWFYFSMRLQSMFTILILGVCVLLRV